MKKELLNNLQAQGIQIYSLSEQAVTVIFGNEINEVTAHKINNFNLALQEKPFPGFRSTVPAYCTLTVYYDPLLVNHAGLNGLNGFEKVSNYLKTISIHHNDNHTPATQKITIPVYYGGDFGPDLIDVAANTKRSVEEVVSLHSTAIYKVYMIGFIPGFAYLGGMNGQLESPRKAWPRAAVPAGAVGIAGKQTGIYPMETPGGWQIIGQTPVKLFDISLAQPSLLKAGDEVVFKPINLQEFNNLSGK